MGRALYRIVQASQWQAIASESPIARPRTRSADRGLKNGNTDDTLSQDVLDDKDPILRRASDGVKEKTAPAPTVSARGLVLQGPVPSEGLLRTHDL